MDRLRRRVFVPLALCAVLAAPAAAELDGRGWKALEERHEAAFAQRGAVAEKQEIVAALVAEKGHRKAIKLLADALIKEVNLWWSVHKDLSRASGAYSKLMLKVVNFTKEEEKELNALKAKVDGLNEAADHERQALAHVIQGVLDGPEGLRKNIMRRAGSGDWAYRAAALRIAAATLDEPESLRFMNKVLPNDTDHRVRAVGMDALRDIEKGWEPHVVGRLGDSSWAIQLQAVRQIVAREYLPAVPHLINALAVARPRVQEAVGDALRKLTGENFDSFADVWQKWWEDHKDDFESSPKMQKMRPQAAKDVEFYGLRIKSDRILFIIDISASMKLETKNENPAEAWKEPPPPTTGGPAAPPPPPPPEEILSGPKVNVAKHELKKAIGKLDKNTTFNIIAFNHVAKQWKKDMTKASEANKKDAFKWIRALQPAGNTYIDGALRLGFRMAGLENFDKAYPDIFLDTIVLLSDGAPTDNAFNAKNMDPQIILDHVAEWNAKQHVVIHCIGVDMVEGVEFLKKLAEQNGGVYVDR